MQLDRQIYSSYMYNSMSDYSMEAWKEIVGVAKGILSSLQKAQENTNLFQLCCHHERSLHLVNTLCTHSYCNWTSNNKIYSQQRPTRRSRSSRVWMYVCPTQDQIYQHSTIAMSTKQNGRLNTLNFLSLNSGPCYSDMYCHGNLTIVADGGFCCKYIGKSWSTWSSIARKGANPAPDMCADC